MALPGNPSLGPVTADPAVETFTLPATAPFRLDLTVWALRRRKTNLVDRWDGHRYTRILAFNDGPVKVSIAQKNPLECGIFLEGPPKCSDRLIGDVGREIQKMLGPGLSLRRFYAIAEKDTAIEDLVRRFAGVKPPRFPAVFEALVNAIACQQVSLDAGIVLLNRLAEKFGAAFEDGGARLYAFPGPEDLSGAAAEDIKRLGFSHQKARAIVEIAAAASGDRSILAGLEEMPNAEAVECLTALRGIGRWSAEYVLLRGLGRLDTFPGDDVGAKNSIQRLFRLDHRPGYEEIKRLTSRWHPYEGLVYFHLLLDKLRLKGAI